jgi:rubrerythrin
VPASQQGQPGIADCMSSHVVPGDDAFDPLERPGRGSESEEGRSPAGRARIELVCVSCGYGVVVRVAPASCPMCRGSSWRPPSRRR